MFSRVLAASAVTVSGAAASATPIFSVQFNDPGGLLDPFRAQIESNLLAAGGFWGARLASDASIEVSVRPANEVARAFGQSVTFPQVALRGGYRIHEQGAGFELRTGGDPNGAAPDIEIGLNLDYLANELWFDPDPITRSTAVPSDRTDAVSVLMHELGHGFAMNGWRADADFALAGSFMSTFDERLALVGGDVFFTGQEAARVYGGPVPMTRSNHRHFGNASPWPGSELVPDLMNGVVFFRGTRYDISELDLALFADIGLPVAATVPAPGAGFVLGVAGVTLLVRRRRRSDPSRAASST